MSSDGNIGQQSDHNEFLAEFEPETEWAARYQIDKRTAARHRQRGLPHLDWGGRIWIHRKLGHEYVVAQMRGKRIARKRRGAGTT